MESNITIFVKDMKSKQAHVFGSFRAGRRMQNFLGMLASEIGKCVCAGCKRTRGGLFTTRSATLTT